MALKLQGRMTWYGGGPAHDTADNNQPALGTPPQQGGIAVLNHQTLGGYWRVHFPNGRTIIERQTDIGPASGTGNVADLSFYSLGKAGYNEHNYPNPHVTLEYLGKNKPSGAKAPLKAPRTPRTPPQAPQSVTVPGQNNSSSRTALLLQYFQNKHEPGALNQLVAGMGAAQDVAPVTTQLPAVPLSAPAGKAKPAAKTVIPKLGQVSFAPGADRAGVPTGKLIKGLAAHIAGAAGTSLVVGTGTNHNQMTTSGNVSDHWSGNAVDIPVPIDSRRGDLIAGRALMYLGISRVQARHMAQQGGLFNVTPASGPFKGHRVQVIWKTYEGGDHHNHVHIGIRP